MRFVYMGTAGKDDATRASIPLHLAANGSVEVGHETAVVLGGDAVDLVLGDNLQTAEGVGLPPVRDLIAKLVEHEVPIYI